MKKFHYILFLFVLITSCIDDDSFNSYQYDFYSIVGSGQSWIESKFLSGDSISFRINSYVVRSYHKFEPLDKYSISLTCDRDIYINGDTVFKNENIISKLKSLDNKMVYFERQSYLNNKPDVFYYLIIHSTLRNKLKLSNGYYEFKFSAMTSNGNNLNDSILIKYNNR